MIISFLLFFLSAGAIYVACNFFVNGVEWCGHRLKLGATAVGSVLAAFGTALPESAITLSAVAFNSTPAQKDLGVGAAMGGPLVLATLAYAVVGLALIFNHSKLHRKTYQVRVDHVRLSHDQGTFLLIFIVKVSLGLVAFSFKPWLGFAFLAAYAFYVWREIKESDTAPEEEKLEPLLCRPHSDNPALGWALVQTLLALIAVAIASHVFVAQIEAIGEHLAWPPHLIALLLSPVATELPEIVNALIWVRQGKERLALSNISGAMMIQATIPSAFGIFFTPWLFDSTLLASGILTAIAVLFLWWKFRQGHVDGRALVGVTPLYGVFALFLVGHF